MGLRSLGLALPLALLPACRATGPGAPASSAPATPPAAAVSPTPQPRPSEADRRPLVIFLGDSLTAGLGIAESEAYPARIAERLAAEGLPVRVVNAGVSGDTTTGGLARIDWLFAQKPDVLVVALGANDGLRGMPPEVTRENLEKILTRARQATPRVLLVGILVPPSYGEEHARSFARIFPDLARELEVPLVPFLLAGVAGVPELNLDDGIHPNARGQERLAATVLPYLRPLVAEVAARPR